MLISNLVLWIAVVALSIVVLALARQIGVLHERIAPAGALTLSGGIGAGDPVPSLELRSLDGVTLQLDQYARAGRSLLVYFLAPTCPVCRSLLPVVKRLAREESAWLDVLIASDGGEPDAHQTYVEEHHLQGLHYVLSQELGLVFQVSKLPYAALVNEQGVLAAKGLVNTREHLESLLEAHRLQVASINDYLSRHASEERRA